MKFHYYLTAMLMLVLLVFYAPTTSNAHGVEIDYTSEATYKIIASFDNGEPMNEGQVSIYAPSAPNQVWGKGMTNEHGVYYFTPDPAQAGEWYIQVRKAGHGGNVTVNTSENAATGGKSLSTMQTLVMIGSVLWGLLGTTLYFRRKN